MRTILVILLSISITGCASFSWLKVRDSALIAARKTAQAAAMAVLQTAVSQLDKEKKGDFLQGLSGALWTQVPAVINASTVEEIARVWTPDKAHWEELAETLANDFAAKKPRNKEEVQAILSAYAEGLYDAAHAAYDPTDESSWGRLTKQESK